ncbi:MAG: cation:proton antiporter [Bacteroidales bacterium]|nr:cation:proton antiporter [Bacteroidales bacterium]
MGMTLIILGALIFFAHLFAHWFSKLRIPDVLLLMMIGILIGPVFHWVTADMLGGVAGVFASLTLLFVLFDSGVDMSITSIRKTWRGFVQVTLLSFVLSAVVVAIIAHQMGFEWSVSAMLGTMLGGTAAAIVIPLIRQMRVSEYTRTVLTLESALSAVLAIVVSLSILQGFEMGRFSVGRLAFKVLASVLMALVLGGAGGVVWSLLLDRVRKLPNPMFLTAAFLFVVYGLSEALGFSGAISSLAFGIVLGNTNFVFDLVPLGLKTNPLHSLKSEEKSFYKEMLFIFKTYFFVYIGICIPFANREALIYGLIITVALYVMRFLLLAVVGRPNTKVDRMVVSMMIPKGLASAVLASIPEELNRSVGYTLVPCATMIKHVVYAVIFFSIIVCSILVLATKKYTIGTPDDESEPIGDSGLHGDPNHKKLTEPS